MSKPHGFDRKLMVPTPYLRVIIQYSWNNTSSSNMNKNILYQLMCFILCSTNKNKSYELASPNFLSLPSNPNPVYFLSLKLLPFPLCVPIPPAAQKSSLKLSLSLKLDICSQNQSLISLLPPMDLSQQTLANNSGVHPSHPQSTKP